MAISTNSGYSTHIPREITDEEYSLFSESVEIHGRGGVDNLIPKDILTSETSCYAILGDTIMYYGTWSDRLLKLDGSGKAIAVSYK